MAARRLSRCRLLMINYHIGKVVAPPCSLSRSFHRSHCMATSSMPRHTLLLPPPPLPNALSPSNAAWLLNLAHRTGTIGSGNSLIWRLGPTLLSTRTSATPSKSLWAPRRLNSNPDCRRRALPLPSARTLTWLLAGGSAYGRTRGADSRGAQAYANGLGCGRCRHSSKMPFVLV